MPFEIAPEQLFARVRDELLSKLRLPLATYRLQFNHRFRFTEAARIVPYLARLGVTDVYASPYLKASPGSAHGYDVIDYQALNPEIGSDEEHTAFCSTLSAHQLGQVLDFVPNHMGIEKGNAMWDDVLENGPSSIHARVFDIDWDPVKEELKNKVLLPVLGDQYGIVLEDGQLRLVFRDGAFALHYYDRVFPIAPRLYAVILRHRLEESQKELTNQREQFDELQSIITSIEHLPHRTETEPAKLIERNREKEIVKRRLASLVAQSDRIAAFIEHNVAVFNGNPEDARSFDLLDQVLGRCSYRLAHWRVAGEEINYRRFFDINSLAAVRMEDRAVFEEAHQLVFRWLAEEKISGLRIDHPDGLFDPTAYFLNLQEQYFIAHAALRYREAGGAEQDWPAWEARLRSLVREEIAGAAETPLAKALYVVVEKIQGGKERIPDAWAIHGTTGYRFANNLSGLFVDRDNEQALTRIYNRFIGGPINYRQLLYEKKKQVMGISMASEINVLARQLNRISEMNRRTRDFTLNALRRALVELIAIFPVYRTYVDESRPEVDQRDVHYIQWTIARAKEIDPTTNTSLYDFLEDILLRRYPAHLNARERAVMLQFAMKLQQLTGPVMAKGLEDTVFYIYNRLVSLNEVGGEPERFGATEATFHLRNQERAEKWPGSLLTTSTHDTKRSEDVRARINVISEIPQEWQQHLRRWARWNRRYKTQVGDILAPVRNDEYLFYQSALGVWPMGDSLSVPQREEVHARLRQYMLKAIREAKAHTSWINPDPRYEAAVSGFVDAVLDPARSAPFLDDFLLFKRRIERPGQVNALAQAVLKIATPGTTDIYQGCELWDLSLVDPDNRRPVDFEIRERLLNQLDAAAEQNREQLCRELFSEMTDGRIKLYVLSQGLRFRRLRETLFRRGEYLPLQASGPQAAQAISFARRQQGQLVLTVAPRLAVRLLGPTGVGEAFAETYIQLPWQQQELTLKDIFTGRTFQTRMLNGAASIQVGEVLSSFPVSILEKVEG
jgi:(1->4)-alpha-D-glucan 1-alpha-D-glucosylmutase